MTVLEVRLVGRSERLFHGREPAVNRNVACRVAVTEVSHGLVPASAIVIAGSGHGGPRNAVLRYGARRQTRQRVSAVSRVAATGQGVPKLGGQPIWRSSGRLALLCRILPSPSVVGGTLGGFRASRTGTVEQSPTVPTR